MKLSISKVLLVTIVISLINAVVAPLESSAKSKLALIKHMPEQRVIETNHFVRHKMIVSNKSIETTEIQSITKSSNHFSDTYLRLVYKYPGRTNDLGNPVYTLEAYVNGQKYRSFKAVTGTQYTQNHDRDRANLAAPLPDGLYKVSSNIVVGAVPAVGRTFVPIYPQFKTERSDLGIHLNPSFNKRNGHDGTAGCVGLTTPADRDAINRFVLQYHPNHLFVRLLS